MTQNKELADVSESTKITSDEENSYDIDLYRCDDDIRIDAASDAESNSSIKDDDKDDKGADSTGSSDGEDAIRKLHESSHDLSSCSSELSNAGKRKRCWKLSERRDFQVSTSKKPRLDLRVFDYDE